MGPYVRDLTTAHRFFGDLNDGSLMSLRRFTVHFFTSPSPVTFSFFPEGYFNSTPGSVPWSICPDWRFFYTARSSFLPPTPTQVPVEVFTLSSPCRLCPQFFLAIFRHTPPVVFSESGGLWTTPACRCGHRLWLTWCLSKLWCLSRDFTQKRN